MEIAHAVRPARSVKNASVQYQYLFSTHIPHRKLLFGKGVERFPILFYKRISPFQKLSVDLRHNRFNPNHSALCVNFKADAVPYLQSQFF